MQSHHEKERPRVGVAVIVIKEEKILLGKRKNAHGTGQWAPPGGHLEYKETVEACAIRELLEETSLRATSIKLGPWTSNVMENGKHYITLNVFIDKFEGEPKLLEPEKCDGWRWCDCHALPSPLFPTVLSLIERLRSGL